MSVCDMCNAALEQPQGYLLTTRQVVSNPAYWEYAFTHTWAYVNNMPGVDRVKGGLAEQQARQRTPWLVCEACAQRLGEATPQARDYARRWWSSGQTFAPPGSGPAPLSLVRMTRTPSAVEESGIPRPNRLLAFGHGFVPQTEELQVAVQGLVLQHKKELTRDHFMNAPIECESRPEATTRETFFAVVDEVRRLNPHAFILDSICIDQRSGHDTVILAMWEGTDAEKARRCLGNGAVGKSAGIAPLPASASPPSARKPFLSAWTIWCFIPWLNWIAWVHAAIRSRRALYAAFAIPYAVPLILVIALAPAPGTDLPVWLMSLNSMLWLGSIAHVFLMRKKVNLSIQLANEKASHLAELKRIQST